MVERSIAGNNASLAMETPIKAGQYLVIAHGSSAEAAKARDILSTLKPTDLADHVLEPAMQAVTR